jgi:uncharacterized protein
MRFIEVAQTIIIAGMIGYILLALVVTLKQRTLIYNPDRARSSPQQDGLTGVDVWTMPTPDGEHLEVWFAPAQPGRSTVLYFHGNAGYVDLRRDRLGDLQARGFGVLMPSYRGYGGSSGKPTEAANVADAKLAYETLRAKGIAASDIIVMGESLGTGVATQLAASRKVAGLVLDSPYTSMRDLAQRNYPWLPVDWLLWDRYETRIHIKRVTVPLLILHGEADVVVPVAMGVEVRELAVSPVTLLTYASCSHLDHLRAGSFDELERWTKGLRKSGSESPANVRPVGHIPAKG